MLELTRNTMKKIVVFLLVSSLFVSYNASAQTLTKSQKKLLKKEIKTYKKDPIKWVKMQNKHSEEVENLSDEIEQLKALLAEAETQIENMTKDIVAWEEKYVALEKTIPSSALPDGTVYQVQMGYYQYLDLVSFNDKLKTVRAEEIDGKKRYVIGHFDNLLDAVQFSNDIKRIGVLDAFVTEYTDGVRNMNFDAYENLED